MHEASLAGAVLQLVEAAAQRENFKRVTLLRLEVGKLAQVELRALHFSLAAIAPGTVLEGAAFEFEEPEGQACCQDCGLTMALPERAMACTRCGGYRLQLTAGTALRVIDMLVADHQRS